jgi:hypothetical protein
LKIGNWEDDVSSQQSTVSGQQSAGKKADELSDRIRPKGFFPNHESLITLRARSIMNDHRSRPMVLPLVLWTGSIASWLVLMLWTLWAFGALWFVFG